MSGFVRQSKFRHVFAKPLKREFCLDDVRVTKVAFDSLFAAVNAKFLAVICEGSGGPFIVIPLTKSGRVEKDHPLVDAHKAPCLDLAWSPHNDNIIASCSEDCSAKVWNIPDKGLHRTLKEPLVELYGHQRRATNVVWHPSANNILLTAGADMKMFIWNVGNGEALIEIAGHPDLIWSVAFNYNGSKLVTTCKDKKIRIIDPRTGRILQQGTGHEGMKPQRALFLKDGRIFTTGFTKRSERLYALRDEEALEEPIVQDELDTNNGVMFPFYDPDCNMIYLCGKGDSQVRYYEVNNDPPYVHFINVFVSPEPQRGMAIMPKRALSIKDNEIARMYKCTNKGLVEVLQFFVPRKSELFQDDLYPDTLSGQPAMSADEWFDGKDADPILQSLGHRGAPLPTAHAMRVSNLNENANEDGNNNSKQSVPARSAVKKQNMLAQISPPNKDDRRDAPDNADTNSTTTSSSSSNRPSSEARTPKVDTNESSAASWQSSSALRDRATKLELSSSKVIEVDGIMVNTNSALISGHKDKTVEPILISPPAPSSHSVQSKSSTPTTASAGVASSSSSSSYVLRDSSGKQVNIDELIADVTKMKVIIKRHERKIKYLEDQLQDRDDLNLS